MEATMKLNLGCGPATLDGYVNIDAQSWNNGQIVIGDVVNLVAYPENSVDEIFASHILEHLPCGPRKTWDAESTSGLRDAALREWLRVLRPGGILFVAVPDMLALARLLTDHIAYPAMHKEVLSCIFGGHTTQYDIHDYGYTEATLAHTLERIGFKNARRTSVYKDGTASSHRVAGVPVSLNMLAVK
jgi:predicted SAM-dependent methyltransferase